MVATEFAFLFLATALGGFIARTNFIFPAMIYGGADFAYSVYRGVRLGGKSAEQSELDFSFAPLAVWAFIAVLAVAAIGSVAGMKLYLRMNRAALATRSCGS
jgi:hypothetical protein